jgi:putative transposase
MKKSRFSESQIVSILKESEGGIPIADILRTHGISQGTFYKWRSKYSGLEASELKRMKGFLSLPYTVYFNSTDLKYQHLHHITPLIPQLKQGVL